MFCSKCGNQNDADLKYCRQCGKDLRALSIASLNTVDPSSAVKDPDEMTGRGIGRVIVGDGFLMVSVILSVSSSPICSLLWLFLLIPAFFFFGKGMADVLHARQIRRRSKQIELINNPQIAGLPPAGFSFIDAIRRHTSGELTAVPGITERTTRDLN
jgi:hypothetical protein